MSCSKCCTVILTHTKRYEPAISREDASIIIDGWFPFPHNGAVAPTAAKNKYYDLAFPIGDKYHLCNGAKKLILPSQWVSQGEASLPPIYQQNPFFLKYQYGLYPEKYQDENINKISA